MTQTFLRLIGLTACLILFLSACGEGSPTPAGTPGVSAGTATPRPTRTATPRHSDNIRVDPDDLDGVRVQVWHALAGPALNLFAAQAERFNDENEWGIVILPQAMSDYATLFEAMNAALESGALPDLVIALPEQALAWAESARIVDLNPYVYDSQYGLSEGEIADIPPVFWAQDESDGVRLGVPAQRTARLLFYNSSWSRQLGQSSAPRTPQEFITQACAANASFRQDDDLQNDGYGGWAIDTHWQTIYPWLLAFDGGVTSGEEYLFESDQNLEALQFLKDLYDENCAWLSGELTAYDAFAERSALFINGDLSEVPYVARAMTMHANRDSWTVLPFPGPSGQLAAAYGSSYTLVESSDEEQLAAWLFVRWLLSPEIQVDWIQATGLFPLRLSALDSLAGYRADNPQWAAAVELIPDLVTVPQLASWRTVRYVLEDAALSIFRFDLAAEEIPGVLAEMDATAEELNR
ncbi:MAG: extracellular solute-binding protein [Anaerolineales bacterium]|nr:extracellular solute-binding protein [Anaerolineales bacterium]